MVAGAELMYGIDRCLFEVVVSEQAEVLVRSEHQHSFAVCYHPAIDTSGAILESGDDSLDGPVEDAIALVHRLARSPRVRQSFVRHAFRYWMGRNETLEDSRVLLAADRAYLEGGGSFNELLVSLLTSDSFLYRK